MVKYMCDKCGAEILQLPVNVIPIYITDGFGCKLMYVYDKHLCNDCMDKFNAVKDRLQNEQDFFDMSDEDLELIRYDFKVGDIVVTSIGEIGHIESICECEKCKERGFYEPRVVTTIGTDRIYITDTDKENNFSSFYKIGKYTFGNFDRDCLERLIKSKKEYVDEQVNELNMYYKQRDMIEYIEGCDSVS